MGTPRRKRPIKPLELPGLAEAVEEHKGTRTRRRPTARRAPTPRKRPAARTPSRPRPPGPPAPRALHRGPGYHTHTAPGCEACHEEDALEREQGEPREELIGYIGETRAGLGFRLW